MEPHIQYATTSDRVSIAFTQVGDGPDIVCVPLIAVTHAQRCWTQRWHIQPELAGTFRVLHYDSRGSGLSQRDATDYSLDAMVRDMEAAIEAAGLSRFPVFAYWDGVPVAIKYAALHPDRVTHLILAEGWAVRSDYPEETGVVKMEASLRGTDWGLFTNTIARVMAGFDVQERADEYAEYLRSCLTGDVWVAKEEAFDKWDVREHLGKISAPTLVLHLTTNRWLPTEASQRMAAAIPGARLVLSDLTLDYLEFLPVIAEFCGVAAARRPSDAEAVRTVLFTDLVGHAEMMSRLGDERGRAVPREHEAITRDVLRQHGGTEVKTMGDGFMASFGSVSRAVECAIVLQRSFADREGEPLSVRVGLNAGEPIEDEGDLFGATVIIASRIAAKAEGGEILASDNVRSLSAGKGFLFADRGDFVAKGFEEPVRVYEVRWRG